jgi:hypothetical protein
MTSELLRITKKHLIISVPYELQLVPITCPSCKKKHYLDGHLHVFNEKKLSALFADKQPYKKTIKKFHTIYTYNKQTLKLPLLLRLFFDRIVVSLGKHISFFKPNFILIHIQKLHEDTRSEKVFCLGILLLYLKEFDSFV